MLSILGQDQSAGQSELVQVCVHGQLGQDEDTVKGLDASPSGALTAHNDSRTHGPQSFPALQVTLEMRCHPSCKQT